MAVAVENPFSEEDLDNINKALELAEVGITQANLAIRAKIPGADDLLKQAKDQKVKLFDIKRVYFPNR